MKNFFCFPILLLLLLAFATTGQAQTCQAPTITQLSGTNDQYDANIVVDWSGVSNAVSYNIIYTPAGGSTQTLVADQPSDLTNTVRTLSDLIGGKTYTINVSANCVINGNASTSGLSNTATGVPKCPRPANTTVTTLTARQNSRW